MPLPYELVTSAVRGFSESQAAYEAGLAPSPHSATARLLLDAARLSLEARAGYTPKISPQPVSEALANNNFPTCGYKAQQHLKLMLKPEYKPLLQQWLDLLQVYHQRIPDEMIPIILDFGNSAGELQANLRKALGERGIWLVRQGGGSANWDWLLKSSSHPRDYDSHYDAWRDYLIELRQREPERARELAERYWKDLEGMMQLVLLQAFETNLSLDDAAFLEMVLEEECTRIAAAKLLTQIPETFFRQELEEKVGRLLTLAPLGHRNQLVIDFSWTNSFQGYRPKITRAEANDLSTIGNYSFEPHILLMIVPLHYWYETYNLNPHELVQAARNSTHPTMFYKIWTKLAMENNDKEFLFAMVLSLQNYSQAVARALSPEQKEEAALHWIDKNPRFSPEHGVIPLLNAHTVVWGEALSRRFLEILESSFKELSRPLLDAKIRKILGDYAIYFPLSLRDEFARVIHLSARGDFSESEEEQANAILHLLSFRAEMQVALENPND
jgi:hypothetical protein